VAKGIAAKRTAKRVGAYIRSLRRNAGLTQEGLASKIGSTETTVRRWETGEYLPNDEHLIKLGQVFDTTVDAILQSGLEPSELRVDDTGGALGDVPLKGYVSAGLPREAYDVDMGTIPLRRTVLKDHPNAFALIVSGDSLDGDGIRNEDILVVDPDAGLEESKIYVVRIEEEVCARHVHIEDGRVRLRASNDHYEDLKASNVQLLGRVVLHVRKM